METICMKYQILFSGKIKEKQKKIVVFELTQIGKVFFFFFFFFF